ncbi:hypothetical protein NLJ89_g350 [Agrocybe chaxingu]|uniref:Acetyl-CoA synthetase-like protein n=1 Tax=Agrocybe chaxingu TaxID=84603 RepID=A0A9W8N271_9AGAR|nr:hypothetical protein NLJ89_g350 [Agrocybe chaxingu]
MSKFSTPVFPPLDGSLTIPEVIDFNMRHNATQPFYVFSVGKHGSEIVQVSHLEFGRACHRAAHVLAQSISEDSGTVVAVIALADTIVYQAVVAGLIRTGLVPFPISARNSPLAIVNLLQGSSCHKIVGTRATLGKLFDEVEARVAAVGEQFKLNFVEIPTVERLFPKLGREIEDDSFKLYSTLAPTPSLESVCMYLHSSGSTGFPKCIPQTHRNLVEWTNFGLSDLRSHTPRLVMGTMPLPPFHTIGVYLQLIQPLFGIMPIGVFPPVVHSPGDQPMPPTPDNTLIHLKRTKTNCLIIVPAFLHAWVNSQEALDLMKSFIFVGYGGGPISAKVGDALVAAGINLSSLYGGTEFGISTVPALGRGNECDWEWVQFSDKITVNWAPQGDGTYECQILTTEKHHPAIENMQNPRGYATSDTFMRHPTKEGLWRIVGRIDDVIIHSSGEKTVPAPMEQIILGNPMARSVVMFGRNHDQAGVLVEPAAGHEIDVSDKAQVADIRNKIWPSIEEANRNAPAFSKIYKEMVLVTSRDRPLPRSPKGTVMRKAALHLYDEDIEELYRVVESTSGIDKIVPPQSWDIAGLKTWLVEQARDIRSSSTISSSKDLFDQGFDSLSATFLRLRISSALRTSQRFAKAVESLGQNFVYAHPVIDDLARFILDLSKTPIEDQTTESKIEAIENMINKYSEGLDAPLPPSKSTASPKDVVLLTGTTGNIGSHALFFLLQDEGVKKIYALNRPSRTEGMLARHEARFRDKGFDGELLKDSKLHLLEGEASDEKLGLSAESYRQLQESVTTIIHIAWRLDFNLTLSSFESHVRGTRNLIDFARQGPNASNVRFVFTSSVGSALGWDQSKGPYPEEVVRDPQYAISNGYGESKYVLEHSGLQACSIRVGQVCGGQPNGAWATTDWVPIIVKSSLALGALPHAQGMVSWVSMDATAQTILDVAFAKQQPPFALNLVHPRPIKWEEVMGAISSELMVVSGSTTPLPLIPFHEWVKKVEEKAKSPVADDFEKIPGIKLLSFYRKLAEADQISGQNRGSHCMESVGMGDFSTSCIQNVSETMRMVPPIAEADIQRWIAYWKGVGFLV